jgi:hypothetical protein
MTDSQNDNPACPYCGVPLASAKAQQCFACGWDWHDPDNPQQRGDPNWNRFGLGAEGTYATERERELFDQFATCPAVEITGIVSASGCGAAMSGGDMWSLLITFDAWRVGSGPVRTESLTLRRKVSRRELRAFQDRIEAETVIKVRARVLDKEVFGSPEALLEELIERDSDDSELHEYLAELKKPVTHQDDLFGTFTFDRRPRWYTANAIWNGDPVDLHLSADQPDDVDSAVQVARALWGAQTVWSQRIRDYAVQELLHVKNENWLDEGEGELGAEEFKNRMRLEAVTVCADGSFEFWHDDGGLFWGHSIQIGGTLSEGPTDADIPG